MKILDKKQFNEKLEAYCRNWYAKSGKVKDVTIHNLIEGIAQVRFSDVAAAEYVRNAFKMELARKMNEIYLDNIVPTVPMGTLSAIYQCTDYNYPRLFAIVDEGGKKGFAIGKGYDPIHGIWDQGEYNFASYERAVDYLENKYEVEVIYRA